MRLRISEDAEVDIREGFHFYEKQSPELGSYFRDCVRDDIDELRKSGGIHQMAHGYHRSLSRKFPFAI